MLAATLGHAFPVKDAKEFEGLKLRWTADKLFGDVFGWYSPLFKKETGLEVEPGTFWTTSQGYEVALPQFMAKESKWDLIVTTPQYLGDFVETGGVQPLDDYFKSYGKSFADEYWSEVLPVYKEFYSRWNGKTWAVPMDGDILALHYRPSFFKDEKLREKFLQTRKRELTVPQTWEELDEVAQFFTEELKAKDIYGVQIAGTAPWVWSYWYTRAAAYGVDLFDDKMNPGIHSPVAVKVLQDFVNLLRWSPPGVENLGGERLVKNWNAGRTVMAVWFFDLTELGGLTANFGGDVATVPLPGVRQKDGSIRRHALTPYGRVAFIPKNLPEKRKRAAFYAAFRLSHPSISSRLLGDPRCGVDPFMKGHFEVAKNFIEPNTEAGATEPVYKDLAQAQAHLDAGRATMPYAWPQPMWPGASEYLYSLGSHVHKALLAQETPKEALDATAKEWVKVRDRLGPKDQRAAFQQFKNKLNLLNASRTLPPKGR